MKFLLSLFFSLLLVLSGSFLKAQPGSGCETLVGLANALDDVNTGPGLKGFIDNLPPGEGGKAWIALKDTPIDSDVYWLGRVNRWQNAGLNFDFVYSAAPDVVKILRNGDEVAEILSDGFKIKFNGFGGDIVCPLDKTVTVIGRYHENQPLQGIWYLTEDLKLNKHTSIPHDQMTQTNVAALGRNPGGLNALDVPDPPFYNWGLNQDWLYEAAVVRGDIIRILDDPDLLTTRWVYGRPPNHPNFVGSTRTGQEIDFLESYGFIYDNTIPGYKRP